MAMNMDAMLRITARATGGEQVQALGNKIQQVEGVTKRLTSASGLLGGALGALAPVATIGGIGALVQKTIAAGDAMYDMSQRTGVSVEALARFKKAAATSGTDIDAVSKALGKLSKGMYEAAQSGKGPTAEALKALGISATDAAGKLKTADQVTLEIANKFKTMPDGVEKTALAMQLFGKAGAEMIPMLNMGGDAIDKLKVKMTTAFAQKADEYNDKLTTLSGKVGGLAAGLTIALLPALDAVVTGLTAVVDLFSKLPEPMQTVIGLAVGLGIALKALEFAGLAGLAPALFSSLSGLLAWMSATFLPAMVAFFSGPVGWTVLAIAAVVAMAYAFREPILEFLGWVGEQLMALGVKIVKWLSQLPDWLATVPDAISSVITTAWDFLGEQFTTLETMAGDLLARIVDVLKDGITTAWQWVGDRFNDMGKMIKGLYDGAVSLFGKLGDAIQAPFKSAIDWIRGALNSLLRSAGQAVNSFVAGVNQLIAGVNRAASLVNLPQLPYLPQVNIPQFATGAYVTGPTVAQVGEGGQPEYVIRADRMAAASQAFLQGARGVDVVNGKVPGGGGGRTAVYVQNTGPILQQSDGSQWARIEDVAQIAQAVAIMASGRR